MPECLEAHQPVKLNASLSGFDRVGLFNYMPLSQPEVAEMVMNAPKSSRELLLRYLDGNVSVDEELEVAHALRTDPEARAFLRDVALHAVAVPDVERANGSFATPTGPPPLGNNSHASSDAAAAAVSETTMDYAPPAGPSREPSGIPATVDFMDRRPLAEGVQGDLASTISAPGGPGVDSSGGKTRDAGPVVPPDYEVLEGPWKGGMGAVYKARHRPLNRVVAVKLILAGKHASPEDLGRFRQEAEAAAHLSHPNIVSVYEIGEFQGMPYFSLEFIDGPRMSDTLRQASLTPKRAAALVEQVARAVQYSHERGVIHRDLKPANILMTQDDVPKVTDFGLARRLGDDYQEHTLTGQILGTPGFMSPEQARGDESIGPGADIYALGAILYNAITGRAPFVGPTPIETIQQVVSNDPLPPRRLQPNVDRDLETICMKCLEKEPGRRYATAGELADDLRAFQENKPIAARPITRRERLVKWCKRNPRVAALSAVAASLLLLLLGGGYVSAAVISRQRDAESLARQQAEASEEVAVVQAELAMEAKRIVLYHTQEFFQGKPELNPLRAQLLSTVFNRIEQLYSEKYEYDVKEIFRASAIRQLGQIYYEAGEKERALQKFLASESIAKRLIEQGKLPRPDMNLSNLDLAIGDTQRDLGNLEKARDRYLSMIEHRKRYLGETEWLMAEQSLAQAYGRLGDVYRRLGDHESARMHLANSLASRRKWHELAPKNIEAMGELAGALGAMSSLYEATGESAEMHEVNKEALALHGQIALYRSDFAAAANHAIQLKKMGRQLLMTSGAAAEIYLKQAAESFEGLLAANPEDGRIPPQAAEAHYLHGAYLARKGEPADASFDRAIALENRLLAKNPGDVFAKGRVLKCLALAGRKEEAIALADEFALKQDSANHCAFAALGYGMLSQHAGTDPAVSKELAEKCVAAARRFIQLGGRDFKLLRGETDYDFAALQSVPGYREMLEEEEAKTAGSAPAPSTSDSKSP
jgi:tetratricopeptide (TPR) repeat protein/tRNA A-37 threonylcarbamoyl transferase component Bud32